ncbi:MAG TPA: DNA translocase FtsK 4TM domain-containing protein [Bryobacteraceae bacterium]|jgi:S-DNA-T family DNA segregation ATPase FtsK/SpoIIIE
MKFLGPTERPRFNEAMALVLLLVGLCAILSFASYSPLDISWNTVGRAAKPTNLFGDFGAHISDFALQSLGLAAYAFPLGLFCLGWKWVRSSPIEAPGVKTFGFLLLALALCSAFGMVPSWHPIGGAVPASGLLGVLLASFLVEHLNELGALLLTTAALVLSLYLVSTFHLGMVAEWFSGPIGFFENLGARFRAWRTRQAERAASRRDARVRAAVEAAEAAALAEQKMATQPEAAPIRPRRARAAAAGTGFVSETDAPPAAADPMARAGLFAVPAFEPSIVPAPGLRERQPDLEEEEDDIPIHAVEAPEREEIRARKVAAMPASVAPDLPKPKSRKRTYTLPPTDLLNEPPERAGYDTQELKETAARIKAKFEEFNVLGNVVQINPGPVVTTFEFKPEAGIKYSRITSLHEDLCLGLQCESILIERIPGKPTIGIEVPNTKREVIALREVLESPEFHDSPSKLTIALGKDISGRIKVASLETMPHCLIAGSTGSGKSVMLNTLIMSVLYKSTPDDVRMILVDPKRLEMGLYEGVPHLLTPVITDPKKATNALRNAVFEMERRLKLLAIQGVRNIEQYNRKVRQLMNEPRSLFEEDNVGPNAEEELRPLPYVLIIIDELADLMMLERAGVEESVTRLAQMARAVGMHLVLATQRPSVDVITGLIKANFPSRISFRVATRVDSRTVLDSMGAEHLLGKGDMLFLPPGTSRLHRIHGSYVTEVETNQLVDYWKQQAEPEYDKSFLLAPPAEDDGGGESEDSEEFNATEDPVYQDAVRVVCEMGKASTSILQRRLRLGYGRAARILDMMQRDGIIGPPDGSRPREVLKRPDWLSQVDSLP